MEKLNIIVEVDQSTGSLIGWMRDNPEVKTESDTYVGLVESLMEVLSLKK